MYRYDTVLVNKAEGFHMADIGTELRILFPPQTCLAIQVSAIFFFFVFLNFRHAAILFPSSQELLMFYIHIPRKAWIPQWHIHVRTKRNDTWKSRFRRYRSHLCFVMAGLNIQSS